ncbi:flagellar basal body P-ring formation chaperone FlgA, partial [bacterium]|nr:flagellar basal body P-ring formation chaperone FlgA [bacterium]
MNNYFNRLIAFIGIAILVCTSSLAIADIDTIEIRVLPESVVYGEYYQLGDIAELDGFDVESIQKLAKLQIGKSPLPGHSHIISHGQVKRRINTDFPKKKFQIFLPSRPMVSRASLKISVKQLENIALKEIKSYYTDYEDIKVTIKTRLNDIFIPKGSASYEMKRIGESRQVGGYSSWNLSLKLDQKEVKKILIRAKVDVFDQISVAKSEIRKGDRITKDDLGSIKKDISRERKGYQSNPDLIVGQYARRDIFKNESVNSNLIEHPVIVTKGSPIKLIYNTPNLSFSNIV